VATTTPRPYHHGNLREELLARAEEVVREGGLGDLSLRELARDTGVSHAAPRRHFPDRQALLDALALRGFERLGDDLRASAARGRGGLEARMLRLAAAYVRFATREPALLELMFVGKHRDGADELHAAGTAAFAPVVELIASGQAAGELTGSDPAQTGLAMFAAIHGLASLATAGMVAADDLDDAVRMVVAGVLDGLRPR
jgi:AcrR family transcriptional regulator